MKKETTLTTALATTLLAGCASTEISSEPDHYRVYFGTSAKAEQRGIYKSNLDMTTGELSSPTRVSTANRPGFIALHADGKHIYATGEGSAFEGRSQGAVSAFKIMEPGGTLTDINTQPSGGNGPCHISIDPSGENLLVANYSGGSCSVLPIQSDGSLAPPSASQQHTGSSVHPDRQKKAYAHSINTDPSGRYAMVADLGIDKIMIYRFDPDTGTLTPNDPAFIRTEPGGGPRHFVFHPSGKLAFTNLEISNKVTAYSYDATQGSLTELQTISTLPGDFAGQNTTAEIVVSNEGRFLYVSNRGHDSIAIFSIDTLTGELTLQGWESTRGQAPRNFCIDPSGTYLVAANQQSSNVVVYKIDRKTGLLEFTGSEIEVPNPICVRFLAIP